MKFSDDNFSTAENYETWINFKGNTLLEQTGNGHRENTGVFCLPCCSAFALPFTRILNV